jgi:hypothetical protein
MVSHGSGYLHFGGHNNKESPSQTSRPSRASHFCDGGDARDGQIDQSRYRGTEA